MTDAERLAMAQVYHRLYTSTDGRLVLEDMRLSYDQSSWDPDPLVMAWKAGKREVYLDTVAVVAFGKDPQARALKVVTTEPPDAA